MNHRMDVQARSCDLINTFPSLLDQKNTFESQNIMGWSPTNPLKRPVRCVFPAERERLVNGDF